MKSRYPVNVVVALVLLTLCWPGLARADTLSLSDRQLFGRLVSMGPTTVRFAPECGTAIVEFPRSEVRRAERNRACRPKPIVPYSAGGGLCPDTPLELYEVRLKKPNQTILAAEVALADGRLHIRTPSGLQTMHGPDGRFVSVTRGLFCRNTPTPETPLKGFCAEATARAVNFGPEPVFENRILTRGISFYLEDNRGRAIAPDDERGAVVREAFGNAVTQWMSALQDLGPRLPAGARSQLGGMISSTPNGYSVLTPPQVVRLGCPDTAMFVVRYLTQDLRPLTVGGKIKAARAQVAGRTIYLNGVTYPCWRASLKAEMEVPSQSPGGMACMNLTPVFVHELGHAFGLVGHRDSGDPSIMDSLISPNLVWPTPDDALALTSVLLQPVTGTTAGRLDADGMGVEILLKPRK